MMTVNPPYVSEICAALHVALECLPLVRYPFNTECLPRAGAYFFYEDGETWGHTGDKPRIVRVGTHRKNNFRSRMCDHYVEDLVEILDALKPAPKDRSIFRKNIGRALLSKESDPYLAVWNKDFTTPEAQKKWSDRRDMKKETRLETGITKLLREKFSFRFIVLDKESDRFTTEKN